MKNGYNEGKIKCGIKTWLTWKVKVLNFFGGGFSSDYYVLSELVNSVDFQPILDQKTLVVYFGTSKKID